MASASQEDAKPMISSVTPPAIARTIFNAGTSFTSGNVRRCSRFNLRSSGMRLLPTPSNWIKCAQISLCDNSMGLNSF